MQCRPHQCECLCQTLLPRKWQLKTAAGHCCYGNNLTVKHSPAPSGVASDLAINCRSMSVPNSVSRLPIIIRQRHTAKCNSEAVKSTAIFGEHQLSTQAMHQYAWCERKAGGTLLPCLYEGSSNIPPPFKVYKSSESSSVAWNDMEWPKRE